MLFGEWHEKIPSNCEVLLGCSDPTFYIEIEEIFEHEEFDPESLHSTEGLEHDIAVLRLKRKIARFSSNF